VVVGGGVVVGIALGEVVVLVADVGAEADVGVVVGVTVGVELVLMNLTST